MAEKKPFRKGQKAPDFSLKDHHDNDFSPREFRGKKVLLSFHPLAWTGVCARQMKALEENYERLMATNTIPVGVSVDTVPSKNAWAKELGIKKLRMLSDFWPHGKVSKKYGIFRDKDGFSERANIVIDENGRIVFFKKYKLPELPDIDEVINFTQKWK